MSSSQEIIKMFILDMSSKIIKIACSYISQRPISQTEVWYDEQYRHVYPWTNLEKVTIYIDLYVSDHSKFIHAYCRGELTGTVSIRDTLQNIAKQLSKFHVHT